MPPLSIWNFSAVYLFINEKKTFCVKAFITSVVSMSPDASLYLIYFPFVMTLLYLFDYSFMCHFIIRPAFHFHKMKRYWNSAHLLFIFILLNHFLSWVMFSFFCFRCRCVTMLHFLPQDSICLCLILLLIHLQFSIFVEYIAHESLF